MRILIFEDDGAKFNAIAKHIHECHPTGACKIQRVENINDGLVLLGSDAFDLVIVDLMMPQIEGGKLGSNGVSIVQAIEKSPKNQYASLVAITKYPTEAQNNRSLFSDSGALILEYDSTEMDWKAGLRFIIGRIRSRIRYDFIVLCALEKEANAFLETRLSDFRHRSIYGMGVTEVNLGESRGILVIMPRMGLVDAAVYSARLLNLFRPKAMAMSGICGGMEKESQLGQLIVADPCWEYQSGKLTDSGFEPATYPIPLQERVRVILQGIADDSAFIKSIYAGVDLPTDSEPDKPIVAPFTSGSAVVADISTGDKIIAQQRNATAVDMELFGLYRAVHLTDESIKFFGVKSVVDFCNPNKNDDWQAAGCIASARFCVEAIDRLLLEDRTATE